MATSDLKQSISRLSFAQIVIAMAGAVYLTTGAALIVAPEWFFATLGNFPPFNRHYMGDTGAFILPLGIGLLIAVRDPQQHKSLIGVAIAASLLHTANHLYDDFVNGMAATHFLVETVPLIVLVGLLGVAYLRLKKPVA